MDILRGNLKGAVDLVGSFYVELVWNAFRNMLMNCDNFGVLKIVQNDLLL